MKILILGATGATGQQLVVQALDRFHEVTVLVRDPLKLSLNHEKLRVIKGDALDNDVVLKAVKEQDAVLSALGRGRSLRSTDLITNAMNVLIPAMNASGVKRLIFLSSIGVGETFAQANFIQKIVFSTFLKNIFADKARAEVLLRSSTLDWTLVCPVVLTNNPATGKYKVGEKLLMKGMPKMSRADVADFMLLQLNDNTYLKKAALLTS